jgi:hypothetical protein
MENLAPVLKSFLSKPDGRGHSMKRSETIPRPIALRVVTACKLAINEDRQKLGAAAAYLGEEFASVDHRVDAVVAANGLCHS